MVKLLFPPEPNAQPYTQVSLRRSERKLLVDERQVSPFDYPGTYAFTSADVKYFVNNVQQSDTSVPGSISVTVITPEPEAASLMGTGLLLIGGFLVRATRRALH